MLGVGSHLPALSLFMSKRLREDSDSSWFWEGHESHSCRKHRKINVGFTACGKTRLCFCFWVAQRFTAAI